MSMLNTFRKVYAQERLFFFMLIFIVCVQMVSMLGENAVAPEQNFQFESLKESHIENALRENIGVLIFYGALICLTIAGFLMGTVMLGCVIWRLWKGKSIISPLQDFQSSRWGGIDVVKAIILYVFLGYCFGIAKEILVMFAGDGTVLSHKWIHALISMVLDIGLVWFIVVTVKNKYHQNLSHLGLTLKKKGAALIFGCKGYLVFIPILFLSMLISYAVVYAFNIKIEPHPIVPMFFDETSLPVLIFLSLLACIGGPICEEIFFRGFAYPVLKRHCGVLWGMIIVSIFFALIHASVYALIPIFALGMLLVYLYEKTGSLIVPITVHVLHNSVMMQYVIFSKLLYKYSSGGGAL